jgi:ArsR family transcriptional regulator, lead/cadmium/zinc/bismuth-responsive transcriptional repressor
MKKQVVQSASDVSVRKIQRQGERCIDTGADRERVQQGRAALLDDDTYFAVAETFRALADGTRAKIVYSLLQHELCTCDLAAIIGASESVVSQHLRVLRNLRLVKNRRSGKQVFYSLDDLHIRILLSVCLSHVHDGNRQHAGMEQVLAFFNEREGAPPHAAQ